MAERELVKLALVQREKGYKPYLFEVPAMAVLSVGDRVTYMSQSDEVVTGVVLAEATTWRDGDEFRLALATAGQAEPLPRLLSRIKYYDFVYEEEK